jgi:lysosomal alpha-glucosidase
MGIPSCFYPSNFGYRLSDVHNEETGITGTLQLNGNGGAYGHDVETLTVDIMMETATRVHVKVYDPMNKRYEVPIPTPQVTTKALSTSYAIKYTDFPFGFSVIRSSTGRVIFNSTAGGLVFEDQFLQMSAVLSSSNIYGLGEHVAPLKLDMDWQLMSLFARDRGTPQGVEHNLYGVHPFYLNVEDDGNANGVLFLNSNAMDIILQPTPAITYRSIGGILDFYLFLGPKPDDVIQQYTSVSRKHIEEYLSININVLINDQFRLLASHSCLHIGDWVFICVVGAMTM